MIEVHFCTVCINRASDHPEDCTDRRCGQRHWPALCCPGCECRSFEDAHPDLSPEVETR